jgi:mRNA-degrading endonuclease RelE of RelBE toxin-antitoxin system
MTEFSVTPEFEKDLRRLSKKFGSLPNDLETFRTALLSVLPDQLPGTVRIPGLGSSVRIPVFKVRHFRCKSLQGKGSRSGIRIIYGYSQNENRILLLETYYKGDKGNEDRERILAYLQNKESLKGAEEPDEQT